MKTLLLHTSRCVIAVVLAASIGSSSQAAEITSINSSGSGMTLTGATIAAVGSAVTLDFAINDIGQLGQVTSVVFDLEAEVLPVVGPAFRNYAITANITNNLLRTVPGFDVRTGVFSATYFHALTTLPTPNPGLFTFENIPNPNTNLLDGWRFGGLNGGGHALGSGATTSVSFNYQVGNTGFPSADGTATLNFTANPEPTTMLLASLVLIPGIVIARRRRRKGEAAEVAV